MHAHAHRASLTCSQHTKGLRPGERILCPRARLHADQTCQQHKPVTTLFMQTKRTSSAVVTTPPLCSAAALAPSLHRCARNCTCAASHRMALCVRSRRLVEGITVAFVQLGQLRLERVVWSSSSWVHVVVSGGQQSGSATRKHAAAAGKRACCGLAQQHQNRQQHACDGQRRAPACSSKPAASDGSAPSRVACRTLVRTLGTQAGATPFSHEQSLSSVDRQMPPSSFTLGW